MPRFQVADLCTVTPAELEGLWHHEAQWWREHLLWDISHPLEALRRVIGRRGVPGKAVRVGTQTVGYTYYVISESLGSFLVLLWPRLEHPRSRGTLLQATIDAIRQRGVRRIESPCVSMALSLAGAGVRAYGIARPPGALSCASNSRVPTPQWSLSLVQLEPWRRCMSTKRSHYAGSVPDHSRCGTQHALSYGRGLQRSGQPAAAGWLRTARRRGVSVRTLSRTGYWLCRGDRNCPRRKLAQVAVLPAYQRQGVGRMLVTTA